MVRWPSAKVCGGGRGLIGFSAEVVKVVPSTRVRTRVRRLSVHQSGSPATRKGTPHWLAGGNYILDKTCQPNHQKALRRAVFTSLVSEIFWRRCGRLIPTPSSPAAWTG